MLLKLFFDRIKGINSVGNVVERGKPYLPVSTDTHAVWKHPCRRCVIPKGSMQRVITYGHMMDLFRRRDWRVRTKHFLQTETDIGQLLGSQVGDEKYCAHPGDELSPLLGCLPSSPHDPRKVVTRLASALDVSDVFVIAECGNVFSRRDL